MTEMIKELKQHALMFSNEIKGNVVGKDELVNQAYARAKLLNENICPRCWVYDNQKHKLVVDAYANECNVYKCNICGFTSTFSKT